jgi:type VI secretion system protein ImpH
MGLCGAASPLPPFYSQQILDDTLDDDFNCLTLLDLISFPSFRDHAETTLHNQLPSRLLELGEPMSRHILYCLMGAGSRAVLDLMGGDLRDLAFLPLFATEARHADGLALYLSECLGLAGVEVEFLVPRTVAIPEETLCRLGTAEPEPRSLGVGAVLGRRAVDITGMFRLHIAVPDAAQFSRLMPGGALRAKLERAVDLYLTTPLRYELALSLAPGVAPRAALGRGAALGRDAVLSPEPGRPMTLHSPAGGRRAP